MSDTYFTAPDGDDEPTLWLDDNVPTAVLRKCDLPPQSREFWDVLTEAVGAEDRTPEPCVAVVWRGSLGPNPEPDELCENDAVWPGEFCTQHKGDE